MTDTLPEPSWLERTLNRANDKRWAWFPLFSLQPAQHDFVTPAVLLALIVGGLLPAAFLGAVCIFIYVRYLGTGDSVALVAAMCEFILSFAAAVTFQYVSVSCWNRRAARLRSSSNFPTAFSEVVKEQNVDTHNPYRPPNDHTVAVDSSSWHRFPLM